MAAAEYLTVNQLAERLGCAPDEALARVRRVGAPGIVRTADGRFHIPTDAVEQLRSQRPGR